MATNSEHALLRESSLSPTEDNQSDLHRSLDEKVYEDHSAEEGAKLDTVPPSGDGDAPVHARERNRRRALLWGQAIFLFAIMVIEALLLYKTYFAGTTSRVSGAASVVKAMGRPSSSDLPDYLHTSPELLPGPTRTGDAPFLAETDPAPFSSTTYKPNTPLETQNPIKGQPKGGNIFQLHGQLSHYFPNPDGFGVEEYPLPDDASIVQLHMLHRHGARYPTTHAGVHRLGDRIQNYTKTTRADSAFTGELAFLNTWKYALGSEILVPIGKQELFDSGTLHQYMYGHLYANDGTKIIARTTTQDRMVQSAEYFMAGFFGLDWTQNATLVLMNEGGYHLWNNTLAGYYNCPNAHSYVNRGGDNATVEWYNIYLKDAAKRLNASSHGFPWSIEDAYHAQTLCAYETVALGYSAFCSLFTYEDWEGYEYSVDINFAGHSGFQSPTGRAIGIGYVEEFLARLEDRLIYEPTAQVNVTLDSSSKTFPLDQTLYFDFSHDTNIMGVLTAFGLKQFADFIPATHMLKDRQLVVSHLEPFAARLDIEIVQASSPLSGNRESGDTYEAGRSTKYVHFILNQRTLPLGASFPQCGRRDDGWCEFETFLEVLRTKLDEAKYEYSCFGDYASVPYGNVTDGVP